MDAIAGDEDDLADQSFFYAVTFLLDGDLGIGPQHLARIALATQRTDRAVADALAVLTLIFTYDLPPSTAHDLWLSLPVFVRRRAQVSIERLVKSERARAR